MLERKKCQQAQGREGVSLLTGLGNGFDIKKAGNAPLLVGGGVGVPPLYYLAKCLIARGIVPKVALGFQAAEDCFFEREFAAMGCEVAVATLDASRGTRGFVTDAICQSGFSYDYFFACGPEPMLKAVAGLCQCSGQLSFEERMACGFGACWAAAVKQSMVPSASGKDGPVLVKEEVIW